MKYLKNMSLVKSVILSMFVLYCLVTTCECNEENSIEPRGKKKKIALFVYFADLVLKKFFIIKLVYAFVFWVVLHKAGYFLAWFASYLKEQKKHEHHEFHPPHFEYHDHDSYGPYRKRFGA